MFDDDDTAKDTRFFAVKRYALLTCCRHAVAYVTMRDIVALLLL